MYRVQPTGLKGGAGPSTPSLFRESFLYLVDVFPSGKGSRGRGGTLDQSRRAYDTLDRVLEMASESSELELLSQEIADSQAHLRGAKSVESFDLAAAIEREIAEMEERRRRLLDQQASGVAEEQRADASEPLTDESLPATVLSFSRGTEPNERIGWERLTPEDVDRARQEVERHRIEALARHARELE